MKIRYILKSEKIREDLKIYTKKGDKGTTALLTGERVAKNNPRIEAYGTVDELLSYLGLLRDMTEDRHTANILLRIQDRLMAGASLLAAGKPVSELPELSEEDIRILETEIDRMNTQIPPLHHFILPGGDILSSHCHVARTICRRAERRTVAIVNPDDPGQKILLQYLNRLSDYLFVLARFFLYKNGKDETYWLSGG